MSLYRFARLTAVLALLRRYRARLLRMLFAVAFALVTAWLYADVAVYVAERHPDWSATALIVKTLIVYAALLLCFWEIGRMARGDGGAEPSARAPRTPPEPGGQPSALDRLADKPTLASRRDELLDRQRPGR